MENKSNLTEIIKNYYDANDDDVQRIITILNSKTYKRSDQDYDFIDSDIARPMRLQLEYLKVQSVMEKYNINKTIVVFGGTRVIQKRRADIKYNQAIAALEKDPENSTLKYKLKVDFQYVD